MMEKRGMKPADLRKRGAKLVELLARLAAAPRLSKPHATITAPEPYVLETGVLYACPVSGSSCLNPYFSKKHFERFPWVSDGWRQFVVLDRGRAFDYLAWYQPLVCKKPVQQRPRISDVRDDLWWQLDTPKTCPPLHFDRIGIVPIGGLPIDMEKAPARFAKSRPSIVFLGWGGRGAAVNDISIANSMCPSSQDWERWYQPRGIVPEEGPTIMRSLGELLARDLG
jgi:hypothetical protein